MNDRYGIKLRRESKRGPPVAESFVNALDPSRSSSAEIQSDVNPQHYPFKSGASLSINSPATPGMKIR